MKREKRSGGGGRLAKSEQSKSTRRGERKIKPQMRKKKILSSSSSRAGTDEREFHASIQAPRGTTKTPRSGSSGDPKLQKAGDASANTRAQMRHRRTLYAWNRRRKGVTWRIIIGRGEEPLVKA